jgi:hypothetical protein
MTIKQQGGIFGRNPSFNNVDVVDLTVSNNLTVSNDLSVADDLSVVGQLTVTGGAAAAPSYSFVGDTDTGISRPTGDSVNIVGGGNEIARFNTSGIDLKYGSLKVINGQGIDFSATSGTGTSELFDDYEEGTWTPSLGGTTTYLAQSGTYTKIGRMVHVRMLLYINVIGTGSTSQISGLPFAKASGAGAVGAVSSYSGLSTSIVNLAPTISTTIIYTRGVSAAATGNQTVVSIFQNNTYFEFSATYET